jgi:hypothetical protein
MTHILRLDSRDRSNPTDSNTDFNINTTPIHVINARLKQVVIPNIFNNIRSSPASDANNVFTFLVAGVTNTITVPDGFYSISSLLSYMNAELDEIDVVLTYNESSGLITLDNPTGATIGIRTESDGNIMAAVLGITTTELIPAGSSQIFGNKPNLYNYSMVYVASKRISNGYNITDRRGRHPIIAIVPVDVAYGANIVYEPNEQHSINFTIDTNIEDVDLSLVNHQGEIISLPSNHHWIVTVEYDTLLVK